MDTASRENTYMEVLDTCDMYECIHMCILKVLEKDNYMSQAVVQDIHNTHIPLAQQSNTHTTEACEVYCIDAYSLNKAVRRVLLFWENATVLFKFNVFGS